MKASQAVHRTSEGRPWGAWLFVAVASVLYALAFFSGLEHHSSYWGNAYQAAHPGSFPGDAYMRPLRPTMLSLYYGLVRLTGDLWLDDRFGIVLYVALVVLALMALDRTARLFGAERAEERLAILALMLVGHSFRDGQGHLVSQADFNPTMLAGPVALWLLYAVLAGKRLLVIVPLMGLLTLISMKNAWVPILIGLIVLSRERLNVRGRRRAWLAALSVAAAGLGFYYAVLRPPGDAHPALFDYILQRMDQSEANPFLDRWDANLMFLLLCAGGLLVRLPSRAVTARVHLVAIVGVAVFALGGLYLSYAPDALKIPYLVPFDPNRGLWWVIYVLFVAVGVSTVRTIRHARSAGRLLLGLGILVVLYLTPFSTGRAALLALALTTLWLIRFGWAHPRPAMRERAIQVVAAALVVTSGAALAAGSLRRLPALMTLIRHGIIGDNPGAKWIGINEYFRAETDPNATVLTLVTRDYPWRAPGLRFDGSLRVRTGRSMPYGHDVSFHFDYDKLRWNQARGERDLQGLIDTWQRHDPSGVARSLAALDAPDYLVVPAEHARWLEGIHGFAYEVATQIRDFTILRRTPVAGHEQVDRQGQHNGEDT